MNAAELLQKIIAYGADENGIRDRFDSNAELYELCFREFLEEPHFAELKEAVAAGDHKRAFDAAHALKGLSGNLGITAFYEAICTLVESLRAGSYENVDNEYAQVARQYENLVSIFSDKPQEAAEDPSRKSFERAAEVLLGKPQNQAVKIARSKAQTADGKFVTLLVGAITAALILVGFLFSMISLNYRDNITMSSGRHLMEMSNQISLYVEEQIANDWRVADNIVDNIVNGEYMDDDRAILTMLSRKQTVWKVSSLMLYTENGFCTYADGSTETNDIASDLIVHAREQGRCMSVIDSKLIYTVPVETELRYNGSRIAALSVVQDMKTFLDDMKFSSFDEQAWMYLTEDSGVVISMMANESAVPAFNFRSVISDMRVTPLDESKSAEDLLSASTSAAFILSDSSREIYAVSTPINTGVAPLRLFYLAPEKVVNETMNGFSRRLTLFSMLVLVLFGVMAFLTFLFAYRSRKKLLDKELVARERMFDLLVKNTRTAFTLFSVNEERPGYVSSNAADVVGDKYWRLRKSDSGFCMENSTGVDTPIMRQANEMMKGWDGKSPFKSGYIFNEQAAPPNYFEYQLYPVDGEFKDYVGIAQDVTQTYRREEATKNAMDMATRANEAKSRFLSNMSHDIRTPMNAIMNMTGFALENIDQPKKLGQYLHTIRESSEHLLHLINEVLDMSRVESGQTVLTSAPFNIRAEIQKQVDMVQPLCMEKGQTLITDFDGLGSGAVRGDALKLSQIVMNLLSNAVKFTQNMGAIRFTATQIPSLRDDLVDVRFVVEDNGIGISQENLQHIFDPFYRANDKRVSRIEGTGLGLPICKSYVEAMGGAIHCQSEEGEGSIFTVELFFQKAGAELFEAVPSSELGDAPFLGMRCLVAEDNLINQQIAKVLLERVGFIADFAEDGGTCVKKFMQARPGTYDVIYMDIQMPVMDGYQATINIRTGDHPDAEKTPIVAMTANVFAEDIEKARVAGMDAYISKPIMSFDLIEQTNRAINLKKGQTG